MSEAVTRAWRVVGGIAAAGSIGVGAVQISGALTTTSTTIEDRWAADDIGRVEVDTDTGDVRVVVDEATAVVRVRLRMQSGLSDVTHSVRRSGDRLVVTADCPAFSGPRCGVDVEVTLPASVDVAVTTGSGDTVVGAVDGTVEVRSGDGDVRVEEAGGALDLSTDHGDIAARGLRSKEVDADSGDGDVAVDLAGPPRRVSASSDNGDVDVALPEGDEFYAVDATSGNGDVSTAVRTDPAGDRTVDATSGNGDVNVRYR